MGTCVIYIDEAGSPTPHHLPVQNGETPIFTLAALAFPLWEWRARDREYLALKRRFFPDVFGKPDKRDEEREIKGNEICAPRNKTSERRHAFNREVLSFISSHGGTCFGVSFLKNPKTPCNSDSIYNHALQILVERFSLFIAEHSAYNNAILICDSRMKGLKSQDITVARSHMSFIFGNETGRTFINILEAPLFADSRLTVGLQLVDIFASNLFSTHYNYYLKDVEGVLDYSHMDKYWHTLDKLQFKSRQAIGGYQMFGYKVIDHRTERRVQEMKSPA